MKQEKLPRDEMLNGMLCFKRKLYSQWFNRRNSDVAVWYKQKRIFGVRKKSKSNNFRTNLVEFRVERLFSVCNTLLHLGVGVSDSITRFY